MAKNKDQASLYKLAIDKIKKDEKEQMEKAGYVPSASGSGWYKPKTAIDGETDDVTILGGKKKK